MTTQCYSNLWVIAERKSDNENLTYPSQNKIKTYKLFTPRDPNGLPSHNMAKAKQG